MILEGLYICELTRGLKEASFIILSIELEISGPTETNESMGAEGNGRCWVTGSE